MRRAPPGSLEVSALIEFRLLKRKCGVICARSARSSASTASIWWRNGARLGRARLVDGHHQVVHRARQQEDHHRQG